MTPQNLVNPLATNVPYYIETSQFICKAIQLTGSYMMRNIGRWWVNKYLQDAYCLISHELKATRQWNLVR